MAETVFHDGLEYQRRNGHREQIRRHLTAHGETMPISVSLYAEVALYVTELTREGDHAFLSSSVSKQVSDGLHHLHDGMVPVGETMARFLYETLGLAEGPYEELRTHAFGGDYVRTRPSAP
jgi:hypothetical protein